MKRYLYIIITTLLVFSGGSAVYADAKVAFGYFINESDNESFDYLENMLPNSFASALKNRYKIKARGPAKIKLTNIKEGEETDFESEIIKPSDLPVITNSVKAEYFIYGSFLPQENNRIRLRVSIYKLGTDLVFTFEDTGQLETELFRFVDRIALQIRNFIDKPMAFKADIVKEKSKVAILSNLEGTELNELYNEFLTSGYKLSMMQGNELYSCLTDESIARFFQIQTKNASYDYIYDMSLIELLHGTWSGKQYYKEIMIERDLLKKYEARYIEQVSIVIEKLRKSDPELDYIIIVGFDESRGMAWYRCIDVKNSRLVSIEYGIEGESISEIIKKVITGITSPLAAKN